MRALIKVLTALGASHCSKALMSGARRPVASLSSRRLLLIQLFFSSSSSRFQIHANMACIIQCLYQTQDEAIKCKQFD